MGLLCNGMACERRSGAATMKLMTCTCEKARNAVGTAAQGSAPEREPNTGKRHSASKDARWAHLDLGSRSVNLTRTAVAAAAGKGCTRTDATACARTRHRCCSPHCRPHPAWRAGSAPCPRGHGPLPYPLRSSLTLPAPPLRCCCHYHQRASRESATREALLRILARRASRPLPWRATSPDVPPCLSLPTRFSTRHPHDVGDCLHLKTPPPVNYRLLLWQLCVIGNNDGQKCAAFVRYMRRE